MPFVALTRQVAIVLARADSKNMEHGMFAGAEIEWGMKSAVLGCAKTKGREAMAKKKSSELFVIIKAKDMAGYVMTVTDKSPKKFRFTLVSRMQNLCLDIIENLYRANMIFIKSKADKELIEKRKHYQKEAYVSLKLLSYMALLSKEQECILPKQYEQISRHAAETMQMLIAWSKSDQNRYKG